MLNKTEWNSYCFIQKLKLLVALCAMSTKAISKMRFKFKIAIPQHYILNSLETTLFMC